MLIEISLKMNDWYHQKATTKWKIVYIQWGRNEIILREDLFNKIFWNYKFSAKFISKIQKFMGVTWLRFSLVPPSLFIFTILVQMQNSRTFFNLIDQVLNAGLKFKSCCSIQINFLWQIGMTAKSIGAGRSKQLNLRFFSIFFYKNFIQKFALELKWF